MSDPRLTPEELERIAELRRRIMDRHPDADEVNARIRSMLAPTQRTFTEAERKAGARDAVAILTASAMADHDSLDDEDQGVTERWLAAIGQGVEAMPEDTE